MRNLLPTTICVLAVATLGLSAARAQEGGSDLGAPGPVPRPRAPSQPAANPDAAPRTKAETARPAPPGRAPAPAPSGAERGVESRIRLRPVDKATVRIVAVGGADPTAFESARTRVTRVAAIPRAGHGTGVVIDPEGLILTAAHVVWASDSIAVLLPGSDDPMPARVVYVDPNHDIAFLKANGQTPHHLPLPEEPHPLQLSERVSASGYPLDIRQRYPAAVSGEVSRENNDGSLQVAMSVNPGNSGGPVIDAEGRLIGVMSKRGEPRAGVAGIAILEPVRFVLAAHVHARRALADQPPRFAPSDPVLSRVTADFVRTSDERPIYEQTTIPTVQAAAGGATTPEATMIVAAHAWNMHIALLEDRRKRAPEDLGAGERARAQHLLQTAMRLSRRAVEQAPYLRMIYPVARSIMNSGGRSFVPAGR